jgi:DNA modification methylase
MLGPVELRATRDLRPAERNARTHSKKQICQIADSIRRFGFINPVVIDQEGRIVAGHARTEAAKLIGVNWVPVIQVTHLSDLEVRAYILADNKLAENAGWDRELLAIELQELIDLSPVEGFDVSLTGFEAAEIDPLLADMEAPQPQPEDFVPPLPQRAVTRRGDLWLLGKHRLLCGDARSADDFGRLMSGRPAAATFCDPPYNVRVASIVGRGRIRHAEFAFGSGEMTSAQYRRFLTDTLRNAIQFSTAAAIHYVCMDWRHIGDLIDVGKKIYGEILNVVVWNKSNAGQGSFYRSQHELIGVFRVGGGPHRNNIELGRHGRNRSNVWTYPGVNSFGHGRMEALASHPTVKPVALVADALLDSTARGDVVLDQFAGSGTTILAATKVGRIAHAMEYEPRFIDVAIRRWQEMTHLEAELVGGGPFNDVAKARANDRHGRSSTK